MLSTPGGPSCHYEGSHVATSLLTLVIFSFPVSSILGGGKRCLSVVWICISLTINDVEHVCVYLLAFYTSPLEKCPFRSFAHTLIGLFVFVLVEFYMFFIHLACKILIRCTICEYFLPVSRESFLLPWQFPSMHLSF